MPSLFPAAAVVLLLLAAGPRDARPAPAGSFAAAGAAALQAPPSAPAGADARAAAGLPERAPAPRTMREHWPVFAGLALTWAGIIGYLLVVGRRSGRIAHALAQVERPQ
jgi:hypothetical protein